MKLTEIQKQIVGLRGQNLLVSAGAGTGKTRVLVERFLSLVADDHVPVQEILALTFTDKAAAEMKTRILERFKELGLDQARRDLESCYISTFHAFASRLLKEHPLEAGIDPDFRVLEEEEADLLRETVLDQIIEKHCEPGSDAFRLLGELGENTIRTGIVKVYEAARVEGRSIQDFSAQTPAPNAASLIRKGASILRELQEKELEEAWGRFVRQTDWGWEQVEAFRSWAKDFSKKKKKKEAWEDLSACAEEITAIHIEKLALPWRVQFETLARAFETAFEAAKQEQGVLDFDDLQKKLIELLESPSAVNRTLLERCRKQFRFIMVDEFQDTNPLQARIAELLSAGDNLFYVGDYKQSIYSFRGASPAHFLDREKQFRDQGKGAYAALKDNFRTQKPVLDFINLFFTRLWEEDAFLPPALEAQTPEPAWPASGDPELDAPVQILWSENEEKESASNARRREARAMSQKIRSLMDQRAVSPGDIVILFQSMTSSIVPPYEQALKEEGIPYFVVSGRGFYHQPEIRDMMQFLSCLDNPHSDLALAALLRSPIFQISDDALFWLAQNAKKLGTAEEQDEAPLAFALDHFEEHPRIPEAEKNKLRIFVSLFREFQQERGRLRIAELLDKILERTSYGMTVLAETNGIRKYANLKKLVDLAREYESRAFVPISEFIRRVRAFENRELRESEAQVEAEKSGRVVRLMTIHKAKGLEFPVVFLADLGHESRSPESRTFLAQPETGYGFQIQNPLTGEKEPAFSWICADRAEKQKSKEERKRLFYVAATRAKQKLILSGIYKPRKKEKEFFRDMSTWMEWVMAIAPDLGALCSLQEIHEIRRVSQPFVPAEKKNFRRLLESSEPIPVEELITDAKQRQGAVREMQALLENVLPLDLKPSRVIDLPVTAFSVFVKSGIRQPAAEFEEQEETDTVLPEEEGGEVSAADFGTLVHRVLEHTDFRKPGSWAQHLEEIFQGVETSQKQSAKRMIEDFLKSPLAQDIAKAKAVHRELPFVLDERHGKIFGVIDLVFQDAQGGWQIVDYKSGEGDEASAEASGYLHQVKMYAFAFHQISGVLPKKAWVYYLKNQRACGADLSAGTMEKFSDSLRLLQERILSAHLGDHLPAPIFL